MMNAPQSYLVAFGGSLAYKPEASLSVRFGALSVRANIPNSRYAITVNSALVMDKTYDTTKWAAEFATLTHTLINVQDDQLMEIRVNGKLLHQLRVQPIYKQMFWELDPRTTAIQLEAQPLAQIDQAYSWFFYRPASREFYTNLHTLITSRIQEFYQSVPSSALKDAKLGETRYNLAMRFFPFANTSAYVKKLWTALLFGVSKGEHKDDTAFFEAISTANQPRRNWPLFEPVAPKAWLVGLLDRVFSRVLRINDPDELSYVTWYFVVVLNSLFTGVGDAEYLPVKSGVKNNLLLVSKEPNKPLQGVIMCFQTSSSRVQGLQYFDNVPLENTVILRRIDNVMSIPTPELVVTVPFAYGLSFEPSKPQVAAVDNSPLLADGFDIQLLKSPGLVGEQMRAEAPTPLATLPGSELLPRVGRFSGDYYYTVSTLPGAYLPFGGLLYPTRVELDEDKVDFGSLSPLAQLVSSALKPRLNPFRYRVELDSRQVLNVVVPITVNATAKFIAALPAGTTTVWTKLNDDTTSQPLIRARNSLSIELPGVEDSAGVYMLEVSAPATALLPSLDKETLLFSVDFQLFCLRCNKIFLVLENGHGSCVFHAREQPDQGLQANRHRFDPQRNFEIVDGVLLGTISLNPNVYSGIAQTSQTYEERWLCCRRLVPEPGCYVGRHSSTSSGPDLSDWLHNGPRRGTEWQLEKRTSEESFQAIEKAYAEERYTDGVSLEWQFNEMHGGTLLPTFSFVDKEMGTAALRQLLDNGFDSANVVEHLLDSVDFSQSFGLWTVYRAKQLAYQRGSPSVVQFPRELAQRAVDLVRVFRILRNLPIQNPARLAVARKIVVQRWLTLKTVPTREEAALLATQEAELFERFSSELRTLLAEIFRQLHMFLFTEQELNTRLRELDQLISRQATPEEYRLFYQYDVLRAEATALALPFDVLYWTGSRALFESWLTEQFFASSTEVEFRNRVEPALLALRTGQPVVFGNLRVDFGTAEQFETRNARAELLLQQVEQNLANLHVQLRRDAEQLREKVAIVAEFKVLFETTTASIQQQIVQIRTAHFNAQKRAFPGNIAEARQLERYRSVWQSTDPNYVGDLYRQVDARLKVLETSKDSTVKEAIVRALMQNNIADTNRLLNYIIADTLRNFPLPVLREMLARLQLVGFSTSIADSLAYRETLLRDKSLDAVDARLSSFFRSMDLSTNPDGFHSLPVIEQASNQLQERWTQLYTTLSLRFFDEATVLRLLPSNPDFVSPIDGQTRRRDLLQFYEQFINTAANLDQGSPTQIRLLQQVSVGAVNPPIPYIALIRRWDSFSNIRERWLGELKQTLNLLREPPQEFTGALLRTALTAENLAEFSRLIARPAVEALLEYIARNPGEMVNTWIYLAAGAKPTAQDPLVQTLSQIAREPRLVAKELGLVALSEINWPAAPEFAAYRSLLQQITIFPPAALPADSWFVRWYQRTTGTPLPNPNVRYYYNSANALLNLLSSPRLSAYLVDRDWRSSTMSELSLRFEEGVAVDDWLAQFRVLFARIAANAGNSTYQTAMLATVGSLNDSTAIYEADRPARRWQYIRWDERLLPLLANVPPTARPTFAQLNQAYFEITGNLPGELNPSNDAAKTLIMRAELERTEIDQLRVGSFASTPASSRENAASAGWLYHQINRENNDPIAFLVMAVLLAGTGRLERSDWFRSSGRAVERAVRALLDMIDQELKRLDLSNIKPALEEMRNNPRVQRTGISYRRADGRQIELAGSPFLLRPIWPTSGSTLSRAWFTVLSYPFSQSRLLREMRSVDHLYVIEFLVQVGQSYFGEEESELNNYLELLCDANLSLKPESLAYFVHAFVLNPIPGRAQTTTDPFFAQLVAQLDVAPPAPNANSYARHLSDVQKIEHIVVRPLDPFDVTQAIGQQAKTPFELWLLLSGAVNPDAERTRMPIFLEESKRTAILYKSVHNDSLDYYNDPPEFDRLTGEPRHTLINLSSGAVLKGVNGFGAFQLLFDSSRDKNGATVLELTPSLEVYWKPHQRTLERLHKHILKIQLDLYQNEAKTAEQQIDERLQQVYGRTDILSRFFASVQEDQTAILGRIDASPGSRVLPNVAALLREMVQQPYFENNFAPLLPDTDRFALEMKQLHEGNRNYTPYMAATMQILITRLNASVGELAPIRQELTNLWRLMLNIVDNVLVHMVAQTAEVVAVIDPVTHKQILEDLDRKLRNAFGNDVPFDFAQFETRFNAIQQTGPVAVEFISKPLLDQVQLELIGGNIGTQLNAWSFQLIKRIDDVVDEVIRILRQNGSGGQIVLPPTDTPNLRLPLFSRPTFNLSRGRVQANLSDLYMALFLASWYYSNALDDNNRIRDAYINAVEPKVETVAKEILHWNERTGFWQPADALLSLAVLSRDLSALLDKATILKQVGIKNPSDAILMTVDLSGANNIDAQIKAFIDEFVTQAGAVNALSERTAKVFKPQFQTLIRVCNDAEWISQAEAALRSYIKSPSLRPRYNLPFKLEMQRTLLALPVGDLFSNQQSVLYQLFDNWIRPTLTQLSSIWRFLASGSLEHTAGPEKPRPMALRRVDLAGTAFLPLLTSLRIDNDSGQFTQLEQACETIAAWEASTNSRILSSRWPSSEFDRIRARTLLRGFGRPVDKRAELSAIFAERQQLWTGVPANSNYRPMFRGLPDVALRLESLFHFNIASLSREEINRRYRNNFRDSAEQWLSYAPEPSRALPTELPPELLRLIADSEQVPGDVLPAGVTDMSLLAMWPYLGLLEGHQVREAYMRDFVALTIELDQKQPGLSMLSVLEPRTEETAQPPAQLLRRWKEAANEDNNFAHLIASQAVPSSPWGLDLYFAIDNTTDAVRQWAVWDNRLTNSKHALVQYSPHSEDSTPFLLLRGLLDAREIDGKPSALVELEHRADLVSDNPAPKLYYPATPAQVLDLSALDFLPTFPYTGFVPGNAWPRLAALKMYGRAPDVRFQIMERPVPSLIATQTLFYEHIASTLLASGNPALPYPNVAPSLDRTAAQVPPWQNPILVPEADGRPAMIRPDLSTL